MRKLFLALMVIGLAAFTEEISAATQPSRRGSVQKRKVVRNKEESLRPAVDGS